MFAGVIPIVGSIVSMVAYVIVLHNLSKKFGKDVGYTIGLFFLPFIFLPMLAFGDAEYQGGSTIDDNQRGGEVTEDEMVDDVADTPVSKEVEAIVEEAPVKEDGEKEIV